MSDKDKELGKQDAKNHHEQGEHRELEGQIQSREDYREGFNEQIKEELKEGEEEK